MAEYSADELTQVILAGLGEISASAAPFEDTLARVVSGLRKDRTRSFDDLTGHNED